MTELKYGIFSSFILFVWMIIQYTLLVPNFHELGYYVSIVSLIIASAGIYSGIKERRNKTNFGYITYKDAFRTGIVITFIMTIMIVVFTYVYYEYLNPNFVNFLAAETEKKLIQRNSGREEINAAVTIIKYQFSFNVQIIQQLLLMLLGGTIISAVAAYVLKRERRIKPQ